MTVAPPPSFPPPTPARGNRPPGPKGHWLKGHLREFRQDRLRFLTDCSRSFGDVVAIRLGPRRIWALNHPELVEEVLVHQNRKFTKHFALKSAKPTLGEGLLTSEHDFWRRQRRLSQPAFHRDRIAGYGAVMVEAAERMLRGWADGQRRDAQADMMRLTLEIVTKTLFDAEIARGADRVADAMEILMVNFTRRVNRIVPLPRWLPVPENVRFRKAMAVVDRTIEEIIAGRRREKADRGDLLSMLLLATDSEGDGGGMSDRQLRDEVVTLFLAGHETTANTMAWIWLLLSRHPEVEARLHDELDEVLDGGRRPPEAADLPRLRYTDAVVTEALRVLPTVWLLGREAIEPVEIGGYRAPAGTTMWMSQWVIHRDPRWFDAPESFVPDRWLDGLAHRLPRYAYFPFGGGPRVCIGNHFAQMEAVLLLAAIARRFRPLVPEGVSPRPIPTMTLRPEGGLPVILQERRPAARGT
ncbi:cytochrome P450 [Tautonia sociabilis]|uniref:Cytochrome P450 n=1 Tax=Tautonia sociabilis TaxID=2080755 RepID=A0A432MK24_9BACT|nr:cytochrome P450 [Tautonia sociabilis]RUL87751.1 cytochrome P450 [Tautonia sociabilis]